MSQPIRIGQILIEQGVMSPQQVFETVQAQKQYGQPFGVLAEQMFEVTPESIEAAWAEQYHRFTGTIDLSQQRIDPEAVTLIERRQAWQFEMLPLRVEADGELVVAASRRRLPRAATFAAQRIPHVIYFRIADPEPLRAWLQIHHPMPELGPQLKDRIHQIPAEAS